MCLIFTCGEHTFRKEVEGYEGVVCQCHNCGNYSGKVIKSNPWFTFCFVVSLCLSEPILRVHSATMLKVSLANNHIPNTTARSPLVDPRLRGNQLPHLQLCATAREPTGRATDEGRRRPGHTNAEPRPAAGLAGRTTSRRASAGATADGIQVKTTTTPKRYEHGRELQLLLGEARQTR